MVISRWWNHGCFSISFCFAYLHIKCFCKQNIFYVLRKMLFNIITFLKVWTERSTQKRQWHTSPNRTYCLVFSAVGIPLGLMGIMWTGRTDNLICWVTVFSRPKNWAHSKWTCFWKEDHPEHGNHAVAELVSLAFENSRDPQLEA